MTKVNEIYKCGICGNEVEVVVEGGGTLVCCGEPMQLLKENTTDGAREKHVPVVEKTGEDSYRVSVGSVEHPMTEPHYIQWIELVTEDGVLRKHLTPADKPVAEFKTSSKVLFAREKCNLHGLWKG
ncbi:MAG: desulfoferrodoxin [Bacteroidales bacterium]|jgi:superoxide reductase|nr:desulfoferrodoxin [Bacteroidales bacterium]